MNKKQKEIVKIVKADVRIENTLGEDTRSHYKARKEVREYNKKRKCKFEKVKVVRIYESVAILAECVKCAKKGVKHTRLLAPTTKGVLKIGSIGKRELLGGAIIC